MKYPEFKGRKAVLLERCSTAGQADTSIPDQHKMLSAFAQEHDIAVVDLIQLPDVSGSTPGARDDLDQLLSMKKHGKDFDLLLVQDISRFTRAGGDHLGFMKVMLAKAGIDVHFVAANLPRDKNSRMYEAFEAHVANAHAEAISFNSTRGQMSAVESRRIAHSSHAYGLDRLYLASDGSPRYIMRFQADGSRDKLDPKSGLVIDRIPPSNTRRPYRKQPDESVTLVPGDPACIAVIRKMFRWKFIDGWGPYRIAKALNTEGVPSHRGKEWCDSAVRKILQNSVYTGVGIANRYASGIYHSRSPIKPAPSGIDQASLYSRASLPVRLRDQSEWVQFEYDALSDLLEPDVKPLAVAWQASRLGRSRSIAKRSKDRHVDSPYILKGLLRSVQGGHEMTGRVNTPKRTPVRYYAVSRAMRSPREGSNLAKMIPAEPLERAVLSALQSVVENLPDLRARLITAVGKTRDQTAFVQHDRPMLTKQRDDLQQQIQFIIDQVQLIGPELAKQQITERREKLAAVVRSLDAAKHDVPPTTVEQQVESLMLQISHLSDSANSAPPSTLRRILSVFISRLEVDLATRCVTMEVAVPPSISPGTVWDGVNCLDSTTATTCTDEATNGRLHLATFDCQRKYVASRVCFSCTRRAA